MMSNRISFSSNLSIVACSVSALLLGWTAAAEAQYAERVTLNFPEVAEPPVGKLSMIHQARFFNFVYDVQLSNEREASMVDIGVKRLLKGVIPAVAMLVEPSDEPLGGPLRKKWQQALDAEGRFMRLFPESVMAGIANAPTVLQCGYNQYPAAPADDRGYLAGFRNIGLAFWSGPVPEAIAPRALREFELTYEKLELGMHPLLTIGPPAEKCPETLGLALELLAMQFPGQVAATETLSKPEPEAVTSSGADLSYLPRSTVRFFTSILARDPRASDSVANKVGVYLAFHRAFDNACQAEMAEDWDEYTFTRESARLALQEEETIRLDPAELERFYLAATSFVPVVILEYEQDPTKDFGSRDPNEAIPEIYAIRTRIDDQNEAAFSEILAREGCDSSLVDDLRAALADHLPQMTVEEGESTVAMYFQTFTGARSMNVVLDAPYDPDAMRSTRIVSGSDSGLFPLGSDYGGRMLSQLAVGDFGAARAEQRRSSDEVVRRLREMGPPGLNPVADFYERAFQASANLNPMQALIASYIIRRVQILGSCGDPLVALSRTYVETETTRNTYGVELGSREVGRYTDGADVPVAFRHIVESAEDISPDYYSRELVDEVIDRLTCASEMRRNLEANMIAFNNGDAPAFVDPEIERSFGSNRDVVDTGESAYIYAGFDATMSLIEDASRNADARLSLLHDLPDDSDRSAGQLNLLLVDNVPAVAFSTSYFNPKPGGRTPGRIVPMMITCAGNAELMVSQFVWSAQANELDPDASYTMTYGAFGMNGQWTLPVRLEKDYDGDGYFTYARFLGRMTADEDTFAGLRPTSNFTSSVAMGNGNQPLDIGVDGGRLTTTLAPLVDHCRSTGNL